MHPLSNRLLTISILGVISLTSVFAQGNRTRKSANQTSAEFDRFISTLHKALYPELVAPGIAIVVVKDSRVLYLKGFGYADLEAKQPVTPETVFYIASSTKPFFALMTGLLDHKGVIDLDAPLARYLSTVKLQAPLSPETINIRSLLTHTHGIDNSGPVVFRMSFTGQHTPPELVQLISAHRPSERAKEFRYGNIGYLITSLALDAAVKQSWKNVLQQTIISPLGLKNTTAYVSRIQPERLAAPYFAGSTDYIRLHYAKDDTNMHAAGGLVTTVEDLARWLQVNINRGKVGGKQVFPARVITESHRPQADQASQFSWVRRYAYGLGWNIGSYEGEMLVHHYGSFSSFYSHISFMPQHSLGVAVLTHEALLGDRLAENVAQYFYDTLLGIPGSKYKWERQLADAPEVAKRERERIATERARRAGRQAPLSHPLEAFAGDYESVEGGSMEWRVAGGKLAVSIGALQSDAEVFDATKNELRVELVPGSGQVIRFDFSGDRAEGLTYMGMKFKRVK